MTFQVRLGEGRTSSTTPFNILNPKGNKTRGSQMTPMGTNFIQSDNGFVETDPRPVEYGQALQKKTVKELLLMRRQKWNCWQDDRNFAHVFKRAKVEACANELSGPPAPPVNSHVTNRVLENGHVTPQQQQQLQHSALQGRQTPTAKVEFTLFHWQIQQEWQRVGGVSPEMLSLQDEDGDTFLHIAVAKGRRALAYVLATKMAPCGSLDIKEHNGQTALQIAAATNQQFIVQDLLMRGAQINTRDYWGRSPLHLCAEKGHVLSLQRIWMTLAGSGQPIDIEMFNYDGLTPLHVAALSHNAAVKELRGPAELCSRRAKELVQKARRSVQCVETLLVMGASCGTKDLKSGRTCLHVASEEANVELLNVFLARQSSFVNVQTFGGNTALHVVSSLQNHDAQVEAAKLLMRNGADPRIRNFENEHASQLVPEGAIGEKVRKILKYFKA